MEIVWVYCRGCPKEHGVEIELVEGHRGRPERVNIVEVTKGSCLQLRDARMHSSLTHSSGHATIERIHGVDWKASEAGVSTMTMNNGPTSHGRIGSGIGHIERNCVDMPKGVGSGSHGV